MTSQQIQQNNPKKEQVELNGAAVGRTPSAMPDAAVERAERDPAAKPETTVVNVRAEALKAKLPVATQSSASPKGDEPDRSLEPDKPKKAAQLESRATDAPSAKVNADGGDTAITSEGQSAAPTKEQREEKKVEKQQAIAGGTTQASSPETTTKSSTAPSDTLQLDEPRSRSTSGFYTGASSFLGTDSFGLDSITLNSGPKTTGLTLEDGPSSAARARELTAKLSGEINTGITSSQGIDGGSGSDLGAATATSRSAVDMGLTEYAKDWLNGKDQSIEARLLESTKDWLDDKPKSMTDRFLESSSSFLGDARDWLGESAQELGLVWSDTKDKFVSAWDYATDTVGSWLNDSFGDGSYDYSWDLEDDFDYDSFVEEPMAVVGGIFADYMADERSDYGWFDPQPVYTFYAEKDTPYGVGEEVAAKEEQKDKIEAVLIAHNVPPEDRTYVLNNAQFNSFGEPVNQLAFDLIYNRKTPSDSSNTLEPVTTFAGDRSAVA